MIKVVTIEITDELLREQEIRYQKIQRVKKAFAEIKNCYGEAKPISEELVREYNEAVKDL